LITRKMFDVELQATPAALHILLLVFLKYIHPFFTGLLAR
jgi:hypothetical protein